MSLPSKAGQGGRQAPSQRDFSRPHPPSQDGCQKPPRHSQRSVPRPVRQQAASGEKAPGLVGALVSGISPLAWERFRLWIVLIVFAVLFGAVWWRIWVLQGLDGNEHKLAERARRQHSLVDRVTGRRGMILDRTGMVLARSVEVCSVEADVRKIMGSKEGTAIEVANALGRILGVEPQKIYETITGTKHRVVLIKRKIDDKTAEAVRAANLVGVALTKEYDRVYPSKHMAGQLLGFVGDDGVGLEGLEKSLESRIGVKAAHQVTRRDAGGKESFLPREGEDSPHGQDVTLTLDMQVQFFAEEAVERAVKKGGARWGGAIVVDARNGEILAWAQYPFFNPNNFRSVSQKVLRNRLAQDALEPGSTFKPFIMAAAITEHKVTKSTLINCESSGKWNTGSAVIRDTTPHGTVPASHVIRYSSNIGMAKIGESLGIDTIRSYLGRLGFGSVVDIPVKQSKGIVRSRRHWSRLDGLSAAFGQSVSVTVPQMAQAYMAIMHDGVRVPLKLVLDNEGTRRGETVFSAAAATDVREMMRDVVEASDGTGARAKVEGVSVAGKTGTAQKADRGRSYGQRRTCAFAGFFPASRPQYFIYVVIDEPQQLKYGGLIAAPAFSEIAQRIVSYSGMLASVTKRAAPKSAEERASAAKNRAVRKLKQSGLESPFEQGDKSAVSQLLPRGPEIVAGQRNLKAPGRVPSVCGKTLRAALEAFGRTGVMPKIVGTGKLVVRQSPQGGELWPPDGVTKEFTLWLGD